MKTGKKILILLAALILVAAGAGYLLLRGMLPPTRGQLMVPGGLDHSVRIRRNRYGVPLIEARTLPDMLFSIGFLHASDRLFQMDLSRRNAQGSLSEVFGERALDHDRRQQRLLVRESMDQDLKRVPDFLKSLMMHYCDGVNYYISQHPLPLEFKILGYKPGGWEIRDSLSILKNMQSILEGSGSELYNQQLRTALGDKKYQLLFRHRFTSPSIVGEGELRDTPQNTDLGALIARERLISEYQVGSNSWVIGGERTRSGMPILANDPHLPNVFPAFFYQVKCTFADQELCGNTLPGFPFLVIGRNRHLAWGFTNVGNDVIDYGVLEIHPRDPDQYRVGDQWRDFRIHNRLIRVKNGNPREVEVRKSIFGPVFRIGGRQVVRHAMFLYPTTTMEGIYRMNMAGDTGSFRKALVLFNSPGQNVVFADTAGNIGYYPTGLLPRRRLGDGSLPVRITDPAGLWDGFYPETEKPTIMNPAKSYIVTANNPILPDSGQDRFARTWHPAFRAARIEEMIGEHVTLSISQVTRIQGDCLLKNAQYLIDTFRELEFEDPDTQALADILRQWDCRANRGSAPALFYYFKRQLALAVFQDDLGESSELELVTGNLVYRLLRYPEFNAGDPVLQHFADDQDTPVIEKYQDQVIRALKITTRWWKGQKGKLDWGRVHQIAYRHPLGSVFPLGILNRGPYPVAGGNGAILATNFSYPDSFHVTQSPTFRLIIDLGDPSRSLLVNSSGQSGFFMSPYYDDQISLYTSLEYRGMEDFSGNHRNLVLIPGDR